MCHEGREANDRVVAPIGSAFGLPPGTAGGVRAHAEAHAELEDAGESAGRWQTHDQALQNSDPRMFLHAAHQPQDRFGRHETIRVEHDRQFVLVAPAFTEVPDVSGLVSDIGFSSAVMDGNLLTQCACERVEPRCLDPDQLGRVTVAENIDAEPIGQCGGGQAVEQRFDIADHALRQFVADTHKDRCRGGDRLVAGGVGRIPVRAKAHDEKTDRGIPETNDEPGQRCREQRQDDPVDDAEPAGRECDRHEPDQTQDGEADQDGENRPPPASPSAVNGRRRPVGTRLLGHLQEPLRAFGTSRILR